MKLALHFKTNDVADDAFQGFDEDGNPTELEEIDGLTKSDILKRLAKWIEYGECVTLEYDTDTDTMQVVGA